MCLYSEITSFLSNILLWYRLTSHTCLHLLCVGYVTVLKVPLGFSLCLEGHAALVKDIFISAAEINQQLDKSVNKCFSSCKMYWLSKKGKHCVLADTNRNSWLIKSITSVGKMCQSLAIHNCQNSTLWQQLIFW